MTFWYDQLRQHMKHTSFRTQGHPETREYGFTCECSGLLQDWRIDITCLSELVPQALATIERAFGHGRPKPGSKKRKKELRKASIRSRALLHRYLTKEQRLELRATNGITVKGADGRLYRLNEGRFMNIGVEHEGVMYGLCVAPKGAMPAYDVLLAQKVMLEVAPAPLLRVARAKNIKTGDVVGTAAFLLGELPFQPEASPEGADDHTVKVRPLLDLPSEVIENPREWVEARIAEAQHG
jgi:hypothetical protein